jgi:hypothetical protein
VDNAVQPQVVCTGNPPARAFAAAALCSVRVILFGSSHRIRRLMGWIVSPGVDVSHATSEWPVCVFLKASANPWSEWLCARGRRTLAR